LLIAVEADMKLVGVSFAHLAISAAFVSVIMVYSEGLQAFRALPKGVPRCQVLHIV